MPTTAAQQRACLWAVGGCFCVLVLACRLHFRAGRMLRSKGSETERVELILSRVRVEKVDPIGDKAMPKLILIDG